MVRALLLRRSLLALGAIALIFANEAAAQSFDSNIVSRIESFIPPSPETVLPTKTKKTAVKRTETKTVTVEEKKELTDAAAAGAEADGGRTGHRRHGAHGLADYRSRRRFGL
jgi:hypothetical protein